MELVLRRPDGSFCPVSWLMSTLCHEVHIRAFISADAPIADANGV